MCAQTVHNDLVHSQEIAKEATVCLENSLYQPVRRIFCSCDHGILFLRGHLPSFHQKQVAQEAVAKVKGVTQVRNEIEVG